MRSNFLSSGTLYPGRIVLKVKKTKQNKQINKKTLTSHRKLLKLIRYKVSSPRWNPSMEFFQQPNLAYIKARHNDGLEFVRTKKLTLVYGSAPNLG